ncbi:uncharacterized protein LOC127803545 isoform X2 [Diospyros lotus]|uniref:uncharacterized protein LOC127803545 isoform X2 n=1 Tax=Diospyros lotus TaxID=55363 RepID=UPI0022502CDC|nr:uncharacterized protein LOC127803545 isoform X2 [Diospyros lotus]
MDFDEYDYLEKTVEEESERDGSSSKKGKDAAEKSDKGYRRRERSAENESGGDDDFDDRKSKKSRGDEENGSRRERESSRLERHRSSRDGEREKDRHRSSRDGDREPERGRDREREKERDRERRDKEKERDRDRREKEREKEKEKEREKERERERRDKEREKEKEKEREKESERRSMSRSRRSRSRSKSSRRHDSDRDREILRERERELELRESRRFKEKKEVVEPEADPERDQRTVFAYQMPLKATERDVYEFFSKAGKVRDVRLIMDRNSRRSKGVGYIEFYDAMSVPMAIALSGQLLLGQPVMVKPSEAEKNLVQTSASAGGSAVGPYGAIDRKLYVGNLHFNMTDFQLKQIFEAFGPVELVQLPTDPETGHCKGFGFVQFAQLEHAKAAQSLNGKLEIAGRVIKVSSVTDHVGVQDSGAKAADFDDDDGGGLSLNAQSRALLMQKLDRSGIAPSVAGTLGAPVLNGTVPNQQAITMPINGQAAVPAPALPALVTSVAPEPIGKPSECLLLKNMFDPAAETDPEFDLDIKEDVQEECSKYGLVKHIYVDKNSAGYVYLRFPTMEASAAAQRAMHKRWFAGRLISAVFLQPYEYDAKFKGTA